MSERTQPAWDKEHGVMLEEGWLHERLMAQMKDVTPEGRAKHAARQLQLFKDDFADKLWLSIEHGYRAEYMRCREMKDFVGMSFFYELWQASMLERFERVFKPWLFEDEASAAGETERVPQCAGHRFHQTCLDIWSMDIPKDTIIRSARHTWKG